MALHLLFREESDEADAAIRSNGTSVRIWLGRGEPSPVTETTIALPDADRPDSADCGRLLAAVLAEDRLYV